MTNVILDRYYIELFGPDPAEKNSGWKGPLVATSFGLSNALLKEVEENINDLLPEGYEVKVVR